MHISALSAVVNMVKLPSPSLCLKGFATSILSPKHPLDYQFASTSILITELFVWNLCFNKHTSFLCGS